MYTPPDNTRTGYIKNDHGSVTTALSLQPSRGNINAGSLEQTPIGGLNDVLLRNGGDRRESRFGRTQWTIFVGPITG